MEMLNFEFNNKINPCGEIWKAMKVGMTAVSIFNVEVETID